LAGTGLECITRMRKYCAGHVTDHMMRARDRTLRCHVTMHVTCMGPAMVTCPRCI